MLYLMQENAILFDRDLFRKLSALGPDAAAERWESAGKALNLRSMEQIAREVTERGLRSHPSHEGLWYEHILASALSQERLLKTAEDLVASSGSKEWSRVLLSLIDYYLERDEAGLKRLKAVSPSQRNSRYYTVSGHYAMARHAHKEALTLYREAYRRDNKDPRALYHIGECFQSMRQRAQSLKWLYRCVRKERHCVRAWNALSTMHMESGRYELARQATGMALSINPKDWGVYFSIADNLMERGQFQRARAILDDTLELAPYPVIAAEAQNFRGYLFFREGNFDDAVPAFENALELNPQLSVAWLNLGNLHFHRKNLDEAIRCFREALRIDPNQGGASTQLGLAYLEQGHVELARKPLEKASEVDPSDHWAHLGLSEYHRRTKNPLSAVEEAREAVRIEPGDPDVHNYLGIALECNRRYFEAEKAYRRALKLDPEHRWAANNLGYLCEKLLRLDSSYKPAAIEAWKTRLLICKKTNSSVRGALNHLKKLGVPQKVVKGWLGPDRPESSEKDKT